MSAMTEKGITNRGPKKRDPMCFQTLHAILIPAGTILRQDPGKEGTFTCPVAHGVFSVDRAASEAHPDTFKKVVA
jgi:hypothetical protein